VDSDRDPEGHVERIDFSGKLNTVIARYRAPRSVDAISFTPAAWRGGDFLLVSENWFQGPSSIDGVALDPNASTTLAYTIGGFIGESAVDASGSFGSDLFFQQTDSDFPGTPPRSAAIWRIDAAGTFTAFADLHFGEMRFGPGGDWGTDLYVDGLSFAPNGTPAAFATPFNEFAWASGTGFGGDMLAYVSGEAPDVIFRVKPDGTRTPFASGVTGQLTACDGGLWIAYGRGCLVVTPKPGR
jgi:hypothetical protein